jgi:tetratricopeptide (TPR) repeat protein
MNPITYLLSYFRERAAQRWEVEQTSQRWRKACDAFGKGKKQYLEKRMQEALGYLDEAVGCGYVDDADVYAMRGGCLQSLDFDLDAIDDFNRAIALEPENCNLFFQRSFSKESIGDLQGKAADLEKAINLAEIDNKYIRIYDEYAREEGCRNCAHLYRRQMIRAKLLLQEQEDFRKRAEAKPDIWQLVPKRTNMRRRRMEGRTLQAETLDPPQVFNIRLRE